MGGLLRSNVAVASGTAVSRITGLVRVAVLGAVLGTPSAVADAYDLANGTPNMIYELLLGGVLSSSLVPLFTRLHDEDDDEGTSAVCTVAAISTVVVTVAAVLAAPFVFRLYSLLTAASVDVQAYREVGGALARMFLVQILFYGLNALGSALLNARRRFFAAAWAPALSNIAIIATLLVVPSVTQGADPTLDDVRTDRTLRWVLGGGATVGIAVMALALVVPLARAGVRLRFRPDFRHPAVARLRNLSGWALGYVAANQIAIIVVRNLLRGGDGSAFAYSRAYLWFVLPHGLLAMSIATTFLPELSSAIARHDRATLIDRTSLGIRLIALVTLPAGLGLFVLRRPIIGAAFQHGGVSAADAHQTARALGGFALGLAAFSVYLFVLRVFYAHHDARTPFVVNLVENAVNVVLAALLVGRYGLFGLGLSFALAYVVGVVLALRVLATKVRGFRLQPVVAAMFRMLVAAVFMAECVWFAAGEVGGDAGAGAVLRVVVGTVVGAITYTLALVVLRAPELQALRARVRSRSAVGGEHQ